ncbi:biotin-dependent carboxyltransferase [Flavobacteriaceae bacterium AU392]|nr:biotin-dependent carboxyltransferase [Flavobacteriaceae bacterium]RKM85399.1 biotin-dependent carboxyltransferase [Flavobacteriaceae bacterium AU392]
MIEVIKPGFYTTIQDLGRMNYHQYGVPYSGVMDKKSSKIANALLGNRENDAVLEITMTGPTLKFNTTTIISITGADLTPRINGDRVSLNRSISVNKEDVLSFDKLKYGYRCYLAVYGGFQTETVMKSRSMYKNVTSQFTIQKEDRLPVLSLSKTIFKANASIKIDKSHFSDPMLLTYKGPEFEHLPQSAQKQLFSQNFNISKDNNRMAYQLEDIVENKLQPIITSLVQPGTVQLTPSGKLIVLMADGQTAGGYPRILQLTDIAVSKLSQKFTSKKVRFVLKEN